MARNLAVLAVVGLMGCATTQYVPHVRPNRASVVFTLNGVKLVIPEPTILAISLEPPFACDENTRRLAREGPAALEEEPTNIDTFSDLRATRSVGAYRVKTYSGEDLEPGPIVLVVSGTERSHPGTSALNIMNRYNDVAECVDGRR